MLQSGLERRLLCPFTNINVNSAAMLLKNWSCTMMCRFDAPTAAEQFESWCRLSVTRCPMRYAASCRKASNANFVRSANKEGRHARWRCSFARRPGSFTLTTLFSHQLREWLGSQIWSRQLEKDRPILFWIIGKPWEPAQWSIAEQALSFPANGIIITQTKSCVRMCA